jgi:hypothetical protein
LELNILLRGQSNSVYFDQYGGSEFVKDALQYYLGFDGITNKVNLIGTSTPDALGNVTMVGGTSFLPNAAGTESWLSTTQTSAGVVFSNNAIENSLLAHIASLPDDVRSAPTITLWMHNEGDANWAGQSTATWEQAVAFDAAQVRAALGQSAATTPYLFTDVIPEDEDNAASMQAIKAGMEALAADPSFNAGIATHSGDLNMDNAANGLAPGTVIFGGPHMDQTDVQVLAGRIARSVVDEFAQYAMPGSPLALAGGRLDDIGPQAVSATAVSGSPDTLMISVALDPNSTGLTPLTAGAAAGIGWSIQDNGTAIEGVAASLISGNQISVTFDSPVPLDATARLFFGYGTGRIAQGADTHTGAGYPGSGPGSPGQTNAVYDDQGEPVWTAAAGIAITAEPYATVTLAGNKSQYRITDMGNGTAIVADAVAGSDGEHLITQDSALHFTDQTDTFDASGATGDVARLYETSLGRAPDAASLFAYQQADGNIQALAGYIPVSPEFLAGGPLTPINFIDRAFENGLGRAPSATEIANYQTLPSQASILLSVANSAEARIHLDGIVGDLLVAEASRLYQAELGRLASPAEIFAMTGYLAAGMMPQNVANIFGNAPEFIAIHGAQTNAQFVASTYVNALGRPTQNGDDQGWITALDTGATRGSVAMAIGNSAEAVSASTQVTQPGVVKLYS